MSFRNNQRMLRNSVLATFAALGSASLLTADVLTVGSFGSGQYQTIQGAIDAANDGDTVLVSPGTYSVSGTGTVADLRGKRILLQSSHGPGWTTIAYQASASTTGRGLVFTNNETMETVVDGFRIMMLGTAPGSSAQINGPGMTIEEASPSIRNCWFLSSYGEYGGAVMVQGGFPYFDRCTFSGNSGRLGGAVSLLDATVVFDSCTFSGNDADDGGGVILFDLSEATFTNCEFEENTASYDGGGVLVGGGCSAFFEGCSFNLNEADSAGGAVFGGCDLLTFEDCVFHRNWAFNAGGAIATWFTQVIATKASFTGNMADEGVAGHSMLGGGAINSYASTVELTDSEFDGNYTVGDHFDGGQDGGAIRQVFGSELICRSSAFTQNESAENGGAISSDDSVVEMSDCSFSNSYSYGNAGGALMIRGGVIDATDTNFTGGWSMWGTGADASHVSGASGIYERCTFHGGIALTGGGAVAQVDSQLSYFQCQFLRGTADEDGGAVYNKDSNVVIHECLFDSSDAAYWGHAMFNSGGSISIVRSTFSNHGGSSGGEYAIYSRDSAVVISTDSSFCNSYPDHIGGDPIGGMGNLYMDDCTGNFPYPNGLSFVSTIDPILLATIDSNGHVINDMAGGVGVEARATYNQPWFPPFAHAESVGMVTEYERTSGGINYTLATEGDLEALAANGSISMSCEATMYADTLIAVETDRLELLDITITGLGAAPLHAQWDDRRAWVEVYDTATMTALAPMVAGGLDQAWRYTLPEAGSYWILTYIEVSGGATHTLPGGSSGVARAFEETWQAEMTFRVLGDVDDDGIVNGADLTALLGSWGSSNADSDLNGDGRVDGADLSLLLGNWGGP